MPSVFGALNRLLPFATPGTPLYQDLIQLAAICLLFYFGPQIQQSLRSRREEAPQVFNEDDHPVPADTQGEEPAENVDEPPEEAETLQPDQVPVVDEGQPGPAHPAPAQPQRNVGAKKAKSLARKDQRRAYNEFMRSQGDAQRSRDAEGAAEREETLAAERERRRAVEAALEAKREKERHDRRRREETERQEEMQRRERVVNIVREELRERKACNLFKVAEMVGDADQEWVERMVQASGLLGRKGDELTMITTTGWAVRVTADDMQLMYDTAVEQDLGNQQGIVDYEDLGNILDRLVKA
jgi:hypothetical protein